MTLDPALVCSKCLRFWHGPPGQLPYPSPRGVYCDGPHAKPRPALQLVKPAPKPLIDGEVLITWLSIVDSEDAHKAALAEAGKKRRHLRGDYDSFEDEVENRRYAFEAEASLEAFSGFKWNNRGGEKDGPDVGVDIDVKWTDHRDGHLIFEVGKDRPEWRYVLVRGLRPDIWLAGWLYGHEAIRGRVDSRSWGDASRKRWTSAENLRPMRTLETAYAWAHRSRLSGADTNWPIVIADKLDRR